MFKPVQELAQVAGQVFESVINEADIKYVFQVLHGYYGNLFLTKWATGRVVDKGPHKGEDEGIVNARRIWAHSLKEYGVETIKLALRRCQAAHPEFPPSAPQFVALCAACRPRQVYRPDAPTQPAIEMSYELRAKRRAEARAAATEAAHRRLESLKPTGLDALKRAIADAAVTAGGDEAATLARLDRELAPMGAA